MAARTVQKAAIPITNPNAIKPPETNGVAKDRDAASNASPSTKFQAASDMSPTTASALANHPSATVPPVVEASRPTAPKPGNTWQSLDMGGVGIKNIPPTSGLFAFTFLTNLYLNHNALTAVPPQIAKLRHLELLDLSGNGLMTIPVELGMLTSLKELYLFDNHLQTLPPELGTLHQLQTLGIEGNPLEPALKQIVQKDGTPALISYLRDSCPIPASPPDRVWKHFVSQAERDAMKTDPTVETFSVVCYNILCERCATERLYGYTPSWALQWEYRKELIIKEISQHNADFLCLQEGYEGAHWAKSRYKMMSENERRMVDGSAIFYKASKYSLVEKHLIEYSTVAMQRPDFKKTDDMFNRVLGKDHIAVVCLLENKETGTRIIVANTHLHWDPAFSDVKLVQTALLIEEVEKIAQNFARYPPRLPPTPSSAASSGTTPSTGENNGSARPPPVYSDGYKIPVIVCGDLNSIPQSGVYEFLSTGTLPPDHEDFLSHTYGKYTTDGLRHRLGLKSAYAGIGELSMTNYTPTFKGALDYIWYTTSNLSVNAVLGDVDQSYLDKAVGFPNAHFPSEYVVLLVWLLFARAVLLMMTSGWYHSHLCIVADFRVRPPREAPPARPPPVFPESSSRAHN
uniref:CCR4-Not complex 3'-5'-exoribonuclease subunit Ccr4 n=1 Tax=Ganoderma boninense TaxID=34458 RepID=A0A5K1K5A0_9APHY|nr:Ubiquitin-conjugating enzyme E2 2 [Ganoderma boninense]